MADDEEQQQQAKTDKGPEKPLNHRQVRAAAAILIKEARRILKKHSSRIASEPE